VEKGTWSVVVGASQRGRIHISKREREKGEAELGGLGERERERERDGSVVTCP
jgi:hypothetical protein